MKIQLLNKCYGMIHSLEMIVLNQAIEVLDIFMVNHHFKILSKR